MVHRNLLVGRRRGPRGAVPARLRLLPVPVDGGQARRGCGGSRGWRSRSRPTSRCTGSAATTRRTAYAAQAAGMLDARRQDPEAWRALLAGHESHLRRLRSFAPEVYLAVSLRATDVRGRRGRDRRPGSRRAGAWRRCSASATPIAAGRELDALEVEEERRPRSRDRAACRRGAPPRTELQWLLKRSGTRGVCEPHVDPHWQPPALQVLARDGRAEFRPLQRAASGTSTRRSSRRTAAWSSTPRRRAPTRRCWRSGALPEQTVFPGTAEMLLMTRWRP